VDVLRGLKMKSQSFCLWVTYIQDQKFEKEKQELEKQKEQQERNWNRACQFYNENLLKKYFYQGLCQFFCDIHPDRKVEMDQNRVKTAVNRFIIKINSKKNLNEEPPKEEKTAIESPVLSDQQIEEEIPEEIEVIEDDVVITGTAGESGEKSQESTVSEEKTNSTGSKQTVSQPNKGETFKEKVRELEERARRRKESLSLIRKK